MHIRTTQEISKHYLKLNTVKRGNEIQYTLAANQKWICAIDMLTQLTNLMRNEKNKDVKYIKLCNFVNNLKRDIIKVDVIK